MTPKKRDEDSAGSVSEQWFVYGNAVVQLEQFEPGRFRMFLYGMKPDRVPFSNMKGLEEDGTLVTKDEAMRHLRAVRQKLAQFSASARPQP